MSIDDARPLLFLLPSAPLRTHCAQCCRLFNDCVQNLRDCPAARRPLLTSRKLRKAYSAALNNFHDTTRRANANSLLPPWRRRVSGAHVWPDNGRPELIRLSHHCIIGHDNPFAVEPHAIVPQGGLFHVRRSRRSDSGRGRCEPRSCPLQPFGTGPGPGMIRRLAARNFSRIWPLCRPLTIAPRTRLLGYACLFTGFPSRATILLASSVGKRTTIMCRFRRWMYLSLALLGLALSGTNAGAQPMACYPVASWTEVTTAVCIKYACRGGGFQIRCLPAPMLR